MINSRCFTAFQQVRKRPMTKQLHLDPVLVGRIREHLELRSIASAVRKFRRCATTIRRALSVKCLRKSKRKVARAISERTKLIKRISSLRTEKAGRVFPKFACAKVINSELQRVSALKQVCHRTVCRDLRRAGLVNRVRPTVPTRIAVEVETKKPYAQEHSGISQAGPFLR